MIKVKISGDYKTHTGDVKEFELEGVMPTPPTRDEEGGIHEGYVLSHCQNRYFWLWAKKANLSGVSTVRTCALDGIEEVDGRPSYLGKNIKEMEWGELQDLAVATNLLEIPHSQILSKREAREKAYKVYSREVLGKDVEFDDKGDRHSEYSYLKLPALFAGDVDPVEIEAKKTNDQILKEEGENKAVPQHSFSLKELKLVAKERSVTYPPNIGVDALYKKVFG